MKAIYITIVIAVACLAASPVACTINRQQLVAQAIKNGGDPIAVKCAIESNMDDSRSSSMCIIKAMQKVESK